MLMLSCIACAGIDGGAGPGEMPTATDGPPFVLFSSLKYGYRIDIPNGFDIEGLEGKLTSWSYIPPVEEGESTPGPIAPRISVVVADIPSGYSSRSLFDTKADLIADKMNEPDSTLRNFQILEYPGGYALAVDDIDKTDKYAEHHRFYYVYVADSSYHVDISGTAEDLKRWKTYFDHVIESFEVIK
jgi:hypothetical protein